MIGSSKVMTELARAGGGLPAPAAFAVAVQIEGVMPATSYPDLAQATAGLMSTVLRLPIGAQQQEHVRGCLLGAGAAEYLVRQLAREGQWVLRVHLRDESSTPARGSGVPSESRRRGATPSRDGPAWRVMDTARPVMVRVGSAVPAATVGVPLVP